MPINNDLKTYGMKIDRKSSKSYEIIFTEDGVRLDITGWTIYFTVKEYMTDTDANAKIAKTITSHSEPLNGKTLLELTTSDTDLEGNYYYSVDYKDDEANEGVLVTGRVKFEKTVLNSR